MDILQADVQLLQTSMPQTPIESAPDSDDAVNLEAPEFPNVFQQNFSQVAENHSQSIEIKEVLFEPVIVDGEMALPLSWFDDVTVSDISGAKVTISGDSDSTVISISDPADLVSNLPSNPGIHVNPLTPTVFMPASINGEVLPAGGNNLPSAAIASSVLNLREWSDPGQNQAMPKNVPIDMAIDSKNSGDAKLENTGTGKSELPLSANSRPNPSSEVETFTPAEKLADSIIAKLQGSTGNQNPIIDAGLSRSQSNVAALSSVSNLQPGLSTQIELQQLAIAKPENPSEWGRGLGDRVSWMINQKLNSASIRLDPPALGRLEVNIQVRDDITSITINTQHAQTREMIENASFRLRDQLQEAGFQNVNVDVSHDRGQDKSAAGHLADSSVGADIETDLSGSAGDDDGTPETYSYTSDSLVDFFA